MGPRGGGGGGAGGATIDTTADQRGSIHWLGAAMCVAKLRRRLRNASSMLMAEELCLVASNDDVQNLRR